jgi:tartrate dehydrogenase/decarboxylase/D-malate dehydrogenase
MAKHRIAAIAGDSIGHEVLPVGVRVVETAAAAFGIDVEIEHFDWPCADYFRKHGRMMPEHWSDRLKSFDAIYFGAVGWPETVPDHVSLLFRRGFDQYVSLRPARLMPGVAPPFANRKVGDIEMMIVRENTEGEYSTLGGKMFEGTDREFVLQESAFTRVGVNRVVKFAFELAASRPKKHLTPATKSNGIAVSTPNWDERVEAVAAAYPEVRWNKYQIDILTARFVLSPERFDVVVASNLFGDILSDLGPACAGTIGIAPSANLNSERRFPSLFEPVHGSARDIAAKGIANPIATIWSGAMMLTTTG